MKIELFFDYTCPYCYKGHENLLELLPKFPALEIIWRPCEAHPRPEISAVHSDLAIQGMFFVQENGGNLWNYHELVYEAHFKKGLNISVPDVLAACAGKSGVDSDMFKRAIIENKYEKEVLDANRYAWEQKELIAVPSYISGNKFIGSQNGILVSKERLEKFLSSLLKD